jgi:hypothetical protein
MTKKHDENNEILTRITNEGRRTKVRQDLEREARKKVSSQRKQQKDKAALEKSQEIRRQTIQV